MRKPITEFLNGRFLNISKIDRIRNPIILEIYFCFLTISAISHSTTPPRTCVQLYVHAMSGEGRYTDKHNHGAG